jgi:3-hydroxybutyryl-CoA dehydrogenase
LEVVKGAYTSQVVYDKMLRFAKLIKYESIGVYESNGLVNLRLVVVLLNEACQMVMENIAKVEDINRLMIVDYGMRLGIFQIADIIGIEKLVYLMEDMFNESGDKKFKPSPVIWRLFRTKQFGTRTGRGFFIYEDNKIVATNPFFYS